MSVMTRIVAALTREREGRPLRVGPLRRIERMLEVVARDVGGAPVDVSVMHAAAPAEAAVLANRLADSCECRHMIVSEFTPVMGAHTGQGLLGVAYCPAELGAL